MTEEMKQEREFFDPSSLPWRPAAGYPAGVWEQVLAGGADEGVTTRFLRFEPGAGNDAVVTPRFLGGDLHRLRRLRGRRHDLPGGNGGGAPARHAAWPLPLRRQAA